MIAEPVGATTAPTDGVPGAAPPTLRRTAGVWGPLAFSLAAAVAARRQHGYSHRSHHVSGLAAHGEESAGIMIPGFLALGASSLVSVMPDPVLGRLARLAGITTVAAGVVRVSQPRCPQPFVDPDASASDIGHGVASVTTFLLWTAMPVVAAIRTPPSPFRSISRIGAIATSAAFVAAGMATQVDADRKGLVQRAFLGAVFGWTAVATLSG